MKSKKPKKKFKIGDRVLFSSSIRDYINSEYPGGVIVAPRDVCPPKCYEVEYITIDGKTKRMYNFEESHLMKDYGYNTPLKKALEEE